MRYNALLPKRVVCKINFIFSHPPLSEHFPLITPLYAKSTQKPWLRIRGHQPAAVVAFRFNGDPYFISWARPNTLEFIAPFLNRIVNAKGDVNANTHVAHVHFNGLEFRHTSFTLGHIEARVHTDTVIMFENTKDSSVRSCRFENIGGYALWLHLDS